MSMSTYPAMQLQCAVKTFPVSFNTIHGLCGVSVVRYDGRTFAFSKVTPPFLAILLTVCTHPSRKNLNPSKDL